MSHDGEVAQVGTDGHGVLRIGHRCRQPSDHARKYHAASDEPSLPLAVFVVTVTSAGGPSTALGCIRRDSAIHRGTYGDR
jgi:hypothetical protein